MSAFDLRVAEGETSAPGVAIDQIDAGDDAAEALADCRSIVVTVELAPAARPPRAHSGCFG